MNVRDQGTIGVRLELQKTHRTSLPDLVMRGHIIIVAGCQVTPFSITCLLDLIDCL
jgi:hypothetical protein